MTVKINGKSFDWEGTDLYAGEGSDHKHPLETMAWFAVIGIWAYALYPWVVMLIKAFFAPLIY